MNYYNNYKYGQQSTYDIPFLDALQRSFYIHIQVDDQMWSQQEVNGVVANSVVIIVSY